MNIRVMGGLFAMGAVLSLSGCGLWRSVDDDAPPPPTIQRQARLLQVPDDLRLPRAPAVTAPLLTTEAVAQTSTVPPAVAAVPAQPAVKEPSKMLFAPYVPTASESLPPKNWVVDPKHDFPWIAGAQPARVNEETTVGVGDKMFGRLFAKVEFGTGAIAAPVKPTPEVVAAAAQQHKTGNFISRWFKPDTKVVDPVVVPVNTPPTPTLHAAGVQCNGPTCLDMARDMLLQDAERKGWKMLLNRRVSMHQSFQFQRDDRVIWVEVNSAGKNTLDIEYGLLPVQGAVNR